MNFAVSIVNDADGTTMPRDRAFFEFLSTTRIRVTKTIWPLKAVSKSGRLVRGCSPAETLEERRFREWCLRLQADGHEIAMHTASGGDNVRSRTVRAYSVFEEVFGFPPATNVMHGRNQENLYWGKDIFAGNWVLRRLTSAYEAQGFHGHRPGSAYFWGDLCSTKTRYVRLLETSQLNTHRFDPATPFHDPAKPFVPWWFSATYGGRFLDPVGPHAVERLRRERGFSILHAYCHLGVRQDGGAWRLTPRLRSKLELLNSCDDGWFVPVVELLDRVRAVRSLQVHRDQRGTTISNPTPVHLPALALVGELEQAQRGGSAPTRQVLLGDLAPFGSLELPEPLRNATICPPPTVAPNYARMFAGTAGRIARHYVTDKRRHQSSRIG